MTMLDLGAQRELPLVLLIDDDMVSREVTATLLTLSGYTTHTAESGDAALAMLSARICRPAVILMDAQMPGISGATLIARLRETCKQARVYLISGSQPAEELVASSDGLLLKPFNAEVLRKLIEQNAPQVPPSFLDPSEPVVSMEVLRQLRQMMPESAVREIYAAVVTDLKRRAELLGVAISKHDAAEIRRLGHAIKGGCGMAGAVQAARLGSLLESGADDAEDNHFDNSCALLHDLRNAVQALQRILESELPV
jgi:CheY-like chemotaxis protein